MNIQFLLKGLCLCLFSLLLVGCFNGDSAAATTTSDAKGEPSDSEGVGAGDAGDSKDSQVIQSGILTAGDIDDNLNFDAFLKQLNSILQADSEKVFPNISVADRITIKVSDAAGVGVSNARVAILDSEAVTLYQAFTNTEGRFYFFPNLDGIVADRDLRVTITPFGATEPAATAQLNLDGLDDSRLLEITLAGHNNVLPNTLDLMFVVDTTGSMSDELEYLSREFEAITSAIKAEYTQLNMRFALVLYRDNGDLYVVRKFDFNDSVADMKRQLSAQSAGGGGDYPEAMERGMQAALDSQWSDGNAARLLFLVADAPPHDDKLKESFSYAQAARKQGINIYPLAASGVAQTAENLMRAMAVVSHGRYLFLTDDSGVGDTHAEPSVPCYLVTRLDSLLIRVISGALAGKRIEPSAEQVVRTSGHYTEGKCSE